MSGILFGMIYEIFQRSIQNPVKRRKKKFFVNLVNNLKLLFIFAKNSILGVSQGSKYFSAFMLE